VVRIATANNVRESTEGLPTLAENIVGLDQCEGNAGCKSAFVAAGRAACAPWLF
jgi:hypothetical protein